MRGIIATFSLILLILIGIQTLAQGNVTVIDLTGTASADGQLTLAYSSVTVNAFDSTATKLVVMATQTAEAGGFNAQVEDATERATPAPESIEIVPAEPEQTGTKSPILLTMLTLGLVVLVLAFVGMVYTLMTSRTEQK